MEKSLSARLFSIAEKNSRLAIFPAFKFPGIWIGSIF
jgi:hypothetical protein